VASMSQRDHEMRPRESLIVSLIATTLSYFADLRGRRNRRLSRVQFR
jgi:hypothetical protein